MIDLYPNETFFYMWGLFLTVLFLLSSLVFKPTFRILEARKAKTDDLREKALVLSEETRLNFSQYEEAVVNARTKGALAREKILAQAREEERTILDKARSEIEMTLTQIKGRIHKEKEEAQLKIQSMAQGLAKDMVNKILERQIA